MLQRAVEAGDFTALVYALALARVDERRADRALRDVCARFPKLVGIGGRYETFYLTELPYTLRNKDVAMRLVRLLDDPDRTTADGAATLLKLGGLHAAGAVPDLERLFRKSEEVPVRLRVAGVLKTAVPRAGVGLLDRLQKQESSPEVRAQLRQSGDAIRSVSGYESVVRDLYSRDR